MNDKQFNQGSFFVSRIVEPARTNDFYEWEPIREVLESSGVNIRTQIESKIKKVQQTLNSVEEQMAAHGYKLEGDKLVHEDDESEHEIEPGIGTTSSPLSKLPQLWIRVESFETLCGDIFEFSEIQREQGISQLKLRLICCQIFFSALMAEAEDRIRGKLAALFKRKSKHSN